MQNWRKHSYLLIPVVLITAYAAPIVGALLPNTSDTLTESYEPLKTLTFLSTRGHVVHQYGPMANILYAPFYLICLAFWYVKGELMRPFNSLFTSMAHPFEQIGTLVLVARLVGLVLTLIAVVIYARSLEKTARSAVAALVAIVLCVATAPDLIFSAVATNPEGLMLAFLILSMAAYARIIDDGFTYRRGVWLGLSAVASVSCKEQTAPAYIVIYAWLFLTGMRQGRDFWKDMAKSLAVAIGAYLMFNVIYAPGTWLQHMKYWIGGPGEDPEVWAKANYTRAAYLSDALRFFLFNLGPGATVVLIGAAISSLFHRSRLVLSSWIPFLGYAALFAVRSGYLARHYLLPVTVLAALPVALQIAAIETVVKRSVRQAALAAVAVAIALNLWAGNMAWAQMRQVAAWMIEDYATKNVSKLETIHLGNPWKVREGTNRLDYLGYRVDNRPLAELMKVPADRPDVILIARSWDDWMREFSQRPARSEFYESTGYSYANFRGMTSLGYRLAETVHPPMPAWLEAPLFPWYPDEPSPDEDLLVYRKVNTPQN